MANQSSPYFTKKTFDFLHALAKNNNHEWFRSHKNDYEKWVREPALQFISDMQPLLRDVSEHFVASDKKVGGSLFRVMKDTRFEHALGPYKTWVGMRFYHQKRKEVHAPGYYIHVHPDQSFVGGGIWKPDPATLKKIRQFLVDNPNAWDAAKHRKGMNHYSVDGDVLLRMPRGYEDNPKINEDLRRKSFVWDKSLSDAQALSGDLPTLTANSFKELAPVMDYLCAAVNLEF